MFQWFIAYWNFMPLVFINTYKGSHWGYLSRGVHPWVSYAASFIIENVEGSFTRILESHEAATWVVCPFLQQPHSGIVTLSPKIREKEVCLLLHRTATFGFKNDGFRSYSKKQYSEPEIISNDQFWSWSLLYFWDQVSATPWQCWVSHTLHSHHSSFQEGPSPVPAWLCLCASPALSTQTLLTEHCLAQPLGNAGYCHSKHTAFTLTPVICFKERL